MVESELVAKITHLVIQEVTNFQLNQAHTKQIPVGISARHVHLEPSHFNILFGESATLTPFKNLSQPGQFASMEKITISGPKGTIKNVRILGPLRSKTQVEISRTDSRVLGINPPIKTSGDLNGAESLTLKGPKGELSILNCCIIADRHIHMTPADAIRFDVKDNQKVCVNVPGPKGGVMNGVTIRVNENYALDLHIDTDDANAFALTGEECLTLKED